MVPPRLRIPRWKGLSADSEEKHEPVSDIDTVAVDSLKVLDPNRPIREGDIRLSLNAKDGMHCGTIGGTRCHQGGVGLGNAPMQTCSVIDRDGTGRLHVKYPAAFNVV